MFLLTNHEKLLLVSGCSGLLGIVLLLTLCFVCPSCYFNKKIMQKRKREENERKCLRNSFPLSFLEKDPPPPYESTSKSNVDINSPLEFNRRSVNSVSSVFTDTDSVAGIPLPLLSDTEIPAVDIKDNTAFDRGYVNITIQYKRITGEDKKVFPQLRVDLKEAGDLPYRLYGGRINAYFIISLYDLKGFNRKKRRRSGPIPVHQFHSTVVKKSQHPVFNESFFFPMEVNLKKFLLKLEAWDNDKLANDTIQGEVSFNLKDISAYLSQEPSRELDLNLKLEDSKLNNGQILLGLCYLPTAERMTVAVLKATNLKNLGTKTEGEAYFVQAMAIYAGKISERRKTSCHRSSQFPVFNEMLMFDVPFSKLDNIVLLLAVYSTIVQKSSSDEDVSIRQTNNDVCIGKVVIGSSSRKNTLNHWNAMRNSPRRQVIQWHELR